MKIFLPILVIVITSCTNIIAQKPILGSEKTGICSYYSNNFIGRRTYFGENFDQNEYTAAHRTLPYNTILAITNTKNDSTVYVRVTDRGPYSHKRLVDVSLVAAKQLNLIKQGVSTVSVRVVGFKGYKILNKTDPANQLAEQKNEEQ